MDFMGYKNKRVIVSGCFSGMGEATARLLLELGAQVHGLDYKESALTLASFTQVDLRDPGAIDSAIAGIGGKVDALFNCAGLPQTAPPLDVMKVNYAGTRRVTEQVLPLMSEGAAIVSISSNGGLGWSRRIPVLMELLKLDKVAYIRFASVYKSFQDVGDFAEAVDAVRHAPAEGKPGGKRRPGAK